MRIVIIDDDQVVRSTLSKLIATYSQLEEVGSFSNVPEFIASIPSLGNIDFLFLDVEMPDISGVEFLKTNILNCKVILMSSREQYAVEGFNLDVIDFLLKPITMQRFIQTVQKIFRTGFVTPRDFIFFKIENSFKKFQLDEILFFEAMGDYVKIYTRNGNFVTHSTMKTIQTELPESDFLRIHNSFIVRLDKISETGEGIVVINKNVVPVSRSHKKELFQKLNITG